ncbi:hypothetical protein KPH14_012645 [Odynerus spinipes]|uniref:CCHC-type domain-containing protein n=1 Tax=Odynerus spinipes TaxID=1348599 RepID=A0AAD9REV8_9HYME|nr:hypothetical protein KPH14_012645 [Odynerus spinipes]
MDRLQLDSMSLEQLRIEAARLELPVTGSRERLIDTLAEHYERFTPLDDVDNATGHTGSVDVNNIGMSDRPLSIQNENNTISISSNESLREVLVAMSSFLTQQRELASRISDLIQKTTDTRTTTNVHVERERPRYEETRGPPTEQRILASIQPGHAVQLIVSQIPEFAGTDEENVRQWILRVDKVAAIHGASDDVVLLAASSKLARYAKRWYEQQNSSCCESWSALKEGLLNFFDRSVPYSTALKRIEERKWDFAKESFDEYALEKLSLMYRLNLPEDDQISLLTAGINNMSIRAVALSQKDNNVHIFLDRMRRVTQGLTHTQSRSSPRNSNSAKDSGCRNCNRRGHTARQCTSPEIKCFYCREKGHQKWDCPKLKKRTGQPPSSHQGSPSTSTSSATTSSNQRVVATVTASDTLRLNSPFVIITRINDIIIDLEALIDTGSPVSFIKFETYKKLFGPCLEGVAEAKENYTAINNNPLDVIGIIEVKLQLEQLPRILPVRLRVVKERSFPFDVILGRDFLHAEKLTLIYEPCEAIEEKNSDNILAYDINRINLVEDGSEIESTVDNLEIDFGLDVKEKLKEVILEAENSNGEIVDDDYCVSVRLRDDSVYAYAPRKFAYQERVQIREIIDKLMQRGIVKPSTSPYCARLIDDHTTMRYSKEDKIDMIFVYGESRQCLREAVRLYKDRFPNRNCPSVSVYHNLIKKFREIGSVDDKKQTKVKSVTNETTKINVLAAVNENPNTSTRQIARGSGISQSSVVRKLQAEKFHPFHLSLHQELHGTDFENRVNFCQWGLRQLTDNSAFFNKVLFTDEASFTNQGRINLRNMHYWSVENPR